MVLYLRGYTQTWVQPFLTDYMDCEPGSQENSTMEIFTSVTAFKEKLSQAVGMPDEEETARRRIVIVRQTGSVGAYTSTFQGISVNLDRNDDSLVTKHQRQK